MDRIIRILTAGKRLKAIDEEIASATQSGCRVLVKAGTVSASFPTNGPPEKLATENGVIAVWAEGLSQGQGLVWKRIGPDVLFTRPN